jgi:UDP-2,3-diacylglucosamine hydrolase
MIYFISDIHLGLFERPIDKKRENLLLDFLDFIKSDAETVFIVGDLFDYWFEYKYVVPKHFYRTLAKLHDLKESGIKIEYLIGNHDFGHLDFFSKELDIEIHHDDIERELYGKKFYIAHGDGKAHNDIGYRILKKILRANWANRFYRYIHPDFGIKLAATSSKTSRNYTDNKHYGDEDGLENFAGMKIKQGFDFVVMGHRHTRINKKIATGIYINLGDWINEPHCGLFDGKNFTIENVRNLIK